MNYFPGETHDNTEGSSSDGDVNIGTMINVASVMSNTNDPSIVGRFLEDTGVLLSREPTVRSMEMHKCVRRCLNR